VLAPELTEGPYYLDVDRVRSDITEGRPGTPLALALTVVNASTCAPIKDAAVDIWHTDASGVYSGVEGDSGMFMRGTQISDADGKVEFATIYPGWYSGRTVHIHLKVHAGGNEVHTGQLFFPEEISSAVYATGVYASRGDADQSNDSDSIFRESNGLSTLSPQPRGDGYSAAMTVGVKV
jgi:protocatechuate 3,4-dioxygenase beta subunit